MLCSFHLGNPLPFSLFNTNQFLFDYSMKEKKQIKESTFSLQTESTYNYKDFSQGEDIEN